MADTDSLDRPVKITDAHKKVAATLAQGMLDWDNLDDLDAVIAIAEDGSRIQAGDVDLSEFLGIKLDALISYARSLESQLAEKSALTDEQVDLISDALTGLWNRAPQRRAEIERLCISQGWLIEGEGPDD